ncbi:MAG: hypothetical protein WBD20_21870 [Pirellulaceae bacterium]
MSNPSQPPEELSTLPTGADLPREPVRYLGGWPGIIAIGAIVGGGSIGVMFANGQAFARQINPLVLFGIAWFFTLVGTMMLLRGVQLSTGARWLIAAIAAPLAYVLYIPVCSVGAMMLAGGNYNVSNSQAIIASVLSFTMVLLLTCSIVRSIMQKRQQRLTPTHIDSATDES